MATFHEITGTAITGGGGPYAINWPSTVNNGDFLVFAVTQLSTGVVITTPTDWTLVNAYDPGFGPVQNLYKYTADGTETGTFSLASDSSFRGAAQIARYSDASDIDVFAQGNQDFTTTHASSGVTTTADNEEIGVFLSQDAPANPYEPTEFSGGSTPVVQNSSTQIAQAFSRFVQVSQGSTGTLTWSNGDSDATISITYAVANSAGGATDYVAPLPMRIVRHSGRYH